MCACNSFLCNLFLYPFKQVFLFLLFKAKVPAKLDQILQKHSDDLRSGASYDARAQWYDEDRF